MTPTEENKMPDELWVHEDLESIQKSQENSYYNKYWHRYIRAYLSPEVNDINVIPGSAGDAGLDTAGKPKSDIEIISNTLAFFASCIRCGETFDETCEIENKRARAALARLEGANLSPFECKQTTPNLTQEKSYVSLDNAARQEALEAVARLRDGYVYIASKHSRNIDLNIIERVLRAPVTTKLEPQITINCSCGEVEGYVMVPVEPTEEMIDAGNLASGEFFRDPNMTGIYKAMISARPEITGGSYADT